MAEHYGTTALLSRRWHPRDEPKVEGASVARAVGAPPRLDSSGTKDP